MVTETPRFLAALITASQCATATELRNHIARPVDGLTPISIANSATVGQFLIRSRKVMCAKLSSAIAGTLQFASVGCQWYRRVLRVERLPGVSCPQRQCFFKPRHFELDALCSALQDVAHENRVRASVELLDNAGTIHVARLAGGEGRAGV